MLCSIMLAMAIPSSPSADWRARADERINRYRKGNVAVRVVDVRGKPVPDADVRIVMTRHAFRFGTAGPASRILGTDADSERYRDTLVKLFNTFTFENDLKWPQDSPEGRKRVEAAIQWLRARKFEVRGHCLVWGSDRWLPKFVLDLAPEDARKAMADHIADYTRWMRGKVYAWDVVNEAVTEKSFWEKVGWDQFEEAFRLAHKGDPAAKLVYNDYALSDEVRMGRAHRDRAIELVNRLKAAGAPIDMVGDQAHFGQPLTPIPQVNEAWEFLAKQTGLPLEITEFDLSVKDDKVHGEYCRDALVAAFSRPEIQAFILWGFWEGSHWLAKDGAAMIRRDWSLRPAAEAYQDLVLRQWWTRERLHTDAQGLARTRVFYGDHAVTATKAGRSAQASAALLPGGKSEIQLVLR